MKPILLALLICGTAASQTAAPTHQAAKITEIYLEMGRGTVELDKPVGREFMVTLRRDGSAFYIGKANVGLIGNFSGSISAADFDKLANLLIEKKYYKIADELPVRFKEDYPTNIRIRPYESPVVVTGIMYDSKPKFIRRETIVPEGRKHTIPKDIFAIEDAITEVAKKIKWTKVN